MPHEMCLHGMECHRTFKDAYCPVVVVHGLLLFRPRAGRVEKVAPFGLARSANGEGRLQ